MQPTNVSNREGTSTAGLLNIRRTFQHLVGDWLQSQRGNNFYSNKPKIANL